MKALSSSQSGLMHAGQPCCTVLHCSVSTTFFTLDTYGIDCCTMKQVCFVIYIIYCSRCAVCSLVMGWVHVELCWHTVHWTDLLSFTYSAPVRGSVRCMPPSVCTQAIHGMEAK